jgi:hypothetical protein
MNECINISSRIIRERHDEQPARGGQIRMTWIHEIAGKSASGDLLFRDRRLVSLDSY